LESSKAHVTEKGTKWVAQICRVVRQTWGIIPKYARRLYISITIPRILYGTDIWCHPAQGERRDPRTWRSAKAAKVLANTQCAGTLAITGSLRTSPMDMLNAISFLLPAELTIVKIHCRAFTCMLPKDYPLYLTVKLGVKQRVKRHHAPALLGKLLFEIGIMTDHTSSIEEAVNTTEDLLIYSDRSALEAGIGAVVVCYICSRLTSTIHFHLGPDTEHTVHEAKLVGMLPGLHLTVNQSARYKQLMIGVDNQVALLMLHSDLRNPGQHLVCELLRSLNRTLKRKGKQNLEVTSR
jgi:hypothetical protein